MSGAITRILLRYLVGGVFFGSMTLGDRLADDPDIVLLASSALSASVAFAVEFYYRAAKKKGWPL